MLLVEAVYQLQDTKVKLIASVSNGCKMHGNRNEKKKLTIVLLAVRLFAIQSVYKDVLYQCKFSEMVNGAIALLFPVLCPEQCIS